MHQQQQKSFKATPFERNTIYLLSEYYRHQEIMPSVDKTLIIYSVFDGENEQFLCNLHSIAAGIMSPKIKLQGQTQEDQETGNAKRFYRITIDEIKQAGIKVDFIKVHSGSEEDDCRNIRLYEGVVQGETVRVVVVPIQKRLTDAASASNLQKEITKLEQEGYEKARNLKGMELTEFKAKEKETIAELKGKHEAIMRVTHLKMFNIEALLHVVKDKTKMLSVCGLAKASDKLDDKKNEIGELFNIPQNARQYILHTLINLKSLPDLKNNHSISSIWTFKGDTVKCEKNTCFSNQFYSEEGKNIKTNIYGLMNDGKNSSLSTVIEEFNKIWNNITFTTSTCVATIIKRIYELLDYGEDLSASMIDSSKEIKTSMSKNANITITYTFEEIFRRYDIDGNKNLRTNSESILQEFYTPERLDKIKPEKGDKDIIPKSIEKIAFLHYFEQINRKFCEEYTNLERTDSKRLFSHVLQYLKNVYELVKAINESFSPDKTEDNSRPSVYCKNIQTYFNFLDFLFQSSTLIKSITGRQFALESIKAFFDQLKPRDNKLLSYILSHQDDILEDEPIHYYDLYLKIIKDNSKGAQNKIDYIYLHIHRLKADKISSQFIYNKKRVVQAIKSFSEIIYQYDKIPEGKKDRIKKLDIEKKIARLLLVINLPEEGVKIYMKNHLVRSAEKCFKQILQGLNGDEKAKKYIEFGKFFETEFNFAKAIEYYECAFEAAKSTEKRQESIKMKMSCSTRMFNPSEEMKRMFVRFITNQCTEQEFLDTPLKLQTQAQEGQEQPEVKSIFLRLRNKLKWDEAVGASVINEDKSEDSMMMN